MRERTIHHPAAGPRASALLMAAWLMCAALASAGCQESLHIDDSDVRWLCQTDAHCGSGYRCGPNNVCVPEAGAPDVTVDTTVDTTADTAVDTTVDTTPINRTRDCGSVCAHLQDLGGCPSTALRSLTCQLTCGFVVSGDACFDCLLETTGCDQVDTCLQASCGLTPE
ncbi:MAG: hypothetical protein H6746_05210 [Deltaproteobacteria bacterium]|nr:hypothetical protein [Deltaproteobacteria bacterium]